MWQRHGEHIPARNLSVWSLDPLAIDANAPLLDKFESHAARFDEAGINKPFVESLSLRGDRGLIFGSRHLLLALKLRFERKELREGRIRIGLLFPHGTVLPELRLATLRTATRLAAMSAITMALVTIGARWTRTALVLAFAFGLLPMRPVATRAVLSRLAFGTSLGRALALIAVVRPAMLRASATLLPTPLAPDFNQDGLSVRRFGRRFGRDVGGFLCLSCGWSGLYCSRRCRFDRCRRRGVSRWCIRG